MTVSLQYAKKNGEFATYGVMVHAREDSGMSTVLATVGATGVRVVVCSSRAPLEVVVATVLTKEERNTVPPVIRTRLLEDDDGTLPVVTVVEIVLVVQVVDYAPAGIIGTVYTIGINWKRTGVHKGAAELLTIGVGLNTSLTC
jgi:hypothetical protein